MSLRNFTRALTPPIVWRALQRLRRAVSPQADQLQYTPAGWATSGVESTEAGYAKVWAAERAVKAEWIRRLQSHSTQPFLPESDERGMERAGADYVNYLAFAYVLQLAAHDGGRVKMLDFGAGLGDHYWFAHEMLPDITLDYHACELPAVIEEARSYGAPITWHSDASCLKATYDVVMFSASLQCVPDWQPLLRRAAQAARPYLFLTQVSSVRSVPTFVSRHRTRGVTMLCQQLNVSEVLEVAAREGMTLVREFPLAAHPLVDGAPEQPSYRGWLFRRESHS